MVEIRVRIERIRNGYDVSDSYMDDTLFCPTVEEAIVEAQHSFERWAKEEKFLTKKKAGK